VAYVVAGPGYHRQQLESEVRRKMPEYMVPAIWKEIDRMPLTVNGKIDRKRLPGLSPDEGISQAYVAPRNSLEWMISGIWQKILGIDRIGMRDNFFELGGHSLLATRMVSAVRRELKKDLAIRDAFQYPTIGELAGFLEKEAGETALPAIERQELPDRIPLSFSQERLWFIDQLEGSVQYNIPAVLRLKGQLQQTALQKALQDIVDRHEVLRTVIRQQEGRPYQQVLDTGSWTLTVTDRPEPGRNPETLRQYITTIINRPFDLAADHPLRAELIRLDHEEHVLVVTLHHIASDGWSNAILVRELNAFYQANIRQKTADLEDLPIQYADYSIWQRQTIHA